MISWYNIFLNVLWFYFLLKKKFLFVFKIFIYTKFFSIFLDFYYGYFPKVFQDKVFKDYWNYIYDFYLFFFSYWQNIFWLYIFLFFLIFFFFPRFSLLDKSEFNLRSVKLKKNISNIDTVKSEDLNKSITLCFIFTQQFKNYNLKILKYNKIKKKIFNKNKKFF